MTYSKWTRNSVFGLITIIGFSCCKNDTYTEDSPVPNDSISLEEISDSSVEEGEFKKTLRSNGIAVDISSQGEEDLKSLKLSFMTEGSDNGSEKGIKYDGIIQDAVTADLNKDGKMEIYVFNQSAGSGSYGQLFAYQMNGSRLDSISMQDLPEELSLKYLGHDSFAVDKDHLLRFFPLYNEMDANCCPTGGTKKIKYKLEKKSTGLKLIINDN